MTDFDWQWFYQTKINVECFYRKKTRHFIFCSWFRNIYCNGFKTSICFIIQICKTLTYCFSTFKELSLKLGFSLIITSKKLPNKGSSIKDLKGSSIKDWKSPLIMDLKFFSIKDLKSFSIKEPLHVYKSFLAKKYWHHKISRSLTANENVTQYLKKSKF